GPARAVDVIGQGAVLDLVRTLHRQLRSAIVFVSHNLAAVAQLADRIGVLYAGELMELGPARQVLEQPSHPYTRGLIAAVPRIAARPLPQGSPGTAAREPQRFPRSVFTERCAFSANICREVRPVLVEPSGGGHVSRCHFATEPERIGAGARELPGRTAGGQSDEAGPLLEVSRLS